MRTDRRLGRWAIVTTVAAAVLFSLSAAAVAAGATGGSPSAPIVLQELLNGQTQCVSNDADCSIVNLYGQNGNPNSAPLNPNGEQRTTTAVLLNAGSTAASSLSLNPGTCQNQNLNAALPSGDLCSAITLTVACATGGSTVSFGPQTLTAFGHDGTLIADTGLSPGASTTCRFTVSYPASDPTAVLEVRAVQPITWTLAGEAPTAGPATSGPGTGPSGAAPGLSVPGPLAITGIDALALAIVGLALLVAGHFLAHLSRRPEPTRSRCRRV